MAELNEKPEDSLEGLLGSTERVRAPEASTGLRGLKRYMLAPVFGLAVLAAGCGGKSPTAPPAGSTPTFPVTTPVSQCYSNPATNARAIGVSVKHINPAGFVVTSKTDSNGCISTNRTGEATIDILGGNGYAPWNGLTNADFAKLDGIESGWAIHNDQLPILKHFNERGFMRGVLRDMNYQVAEPENFTCISSALDKLWREYRRRVPNFPTGYSVSTNTSLQGVTHTNQIPVGVDAIVKFDSWGTVAPSPSPDNIIKKSFNPYPAGIDICNSAFVRAIWHEVGARAEGVVLNDGPGHYNSNAPLVVTMEGALGLAMSARTAGMPIGQIVADVARATEFRQYLADVVQSVRRPKPMGLNFYRPVDLPKLGVVDIGLGNVPNP